MDNIKGLHIIFTKNMAINDGELSNDAIPSSFFIDFTQPLLSNIPFELQYIAEEIMKDLEDKDHTEFTVTTEKKFWIRKIKEE